MVNLSIVLPRFCATEIPFQNPIFCGDLLREKIRIKRTWTLERTAGGGLRDEKSHSERLCGAWWPGTGREDRTGGSVGAEVLVRGTQPDVYRNLNTAQMVTEASGQGSPKWTRPQPRGKAGISLL